jgi:hypothetical protein
MEQFIQNSWACLIVFGIITILKLVFPKLSYTWKTSLLVAGVAIIHFAVKFLNLIDNDSFSIWPIIFCIIWCIFIISGGKTVAYKTVTGVFSRKTREVVGTMHAGALNWADPIFEITTTSVDGIPNKSADLQELQIKITETPLMHTSTSGIQAKVKRISLMLKLVGDIRELLEIEGGVSTIRERVTEDVEEYFLKAISHISPTSLDKDKANTIEKLAIDLRTRVNKFCSDNYYPYQITKEVIIGDTELEAEYYKVLAKKEFTRLEANAKDLDARRLKKRLLDLGKNLLPTSNEVEQLRQAMISLGITPKDIKEHIAGATPEVVDLLIELVSALKK